jgi:NMD protein affecting ribosome stability and mRNA decay
MSGRARDIRIDTYSASLAGDIDWKDITNVSNTDRSAPTGRRQIHNLRERRHDTYKLRGKLPEPTVCPQCGATYHKGRWTWAKVTEPEAHEHVCPACQRVNDRYPAGELSIGGRFVAEHREEILNLARNLEEQERSEHPLNRIMAIEDAEDGIRILTTDIHLPRRIAEALQGAWNGALDIHYDEAGYFVRSSWRRDD